MWKKELTVRAGLGNARFERFLFSLCLAYAVEASGEEAVMEYPSNVSTPVLTGTCGDSCPMVA